MIIVFSGAGLNTGNYGRVLGGCECLRGEFPVTLSLLKLVTALVQVTCNHTSSKLASTRIILNWLTFFSLLTSPAHLIG